MKKFTLGFIIGGVICSALTGFAVEYAVTANPFPIRVDGVAKSIEGYNINDSTYFKLRDVADAVGGFTVGFVNNTITISTQAELSEQPSESASNDAPITIHEGEVSQRRFAREGDTVIKADGTAVVLKKGVHGILGEGQGVAPDLGVTVTGVGNTTVTMTNVTGLVFSGDVGDQVDSTGMTVNNQSYYVNLVTGEGHWAAEWRVITSAPTEPGEFADQLSEDKNWVWSGTLQSWMEVSVQAMPQEALNRVLAANGLN